MTAPAESVSTTFVSESSGASLNQRRITEGDVVTTVPAPGDALVRCAWAHASVGRARTAAQTSAAASQARRGEILPNEFRSEFITGEVREGRVRPEDTRVAGAA